VIYGDAPYFYKFANYLHNGTRFTSLHGDGSGAQHRRGFPGG
jgi:hypothetical protein